MQSLSQAQVPFNGIKGLESLQITSPSKEKDDSDAISRIRQNITKCIDDLKYFEEMLYVYDGNDKGLRRQLRTLLANSRIEIISALEELNAPSFLMNKSKCDNTHEWLREIEAWLAENKPLRVSLKLLCRPKLNEENEEEF